GLVEHTAQDELHEGFGRIVRPPSERLEDVDQLRFVGKTVLHAAILPNRALHAAAPAAVEFEAANAFVEPLRRAAAGDQVEGNRANPEEIRPIFLALQEDDLRLLAVFDLVGARGDLHAHRGGRRAGDDVLDDVADADPVPTEEHAVAFFDEAAAELGIPDVEK